MNEFSNKIRMQKCGQKSTISEAKDFKSEAKANDMVTWPQISSRTPSLDLTDCYCTDAHTDHTI